jgi:cysteine desulfurase / selenocysteine lyase
MPLAPDVMKRVQGDIRPLRAHFNHAGMSLTPAPAFARVQEHLELEAQIGGYEAAETVEPELAAVSDSIARLLNASAAECAGTESATASWEWALWAMAESFHWSERDRILVDQFAYNTMHASLRRLAQAHRIEVIEVGALPDGRIDPDALTAALDDRVRLVLVTHMPTHVGTVTDAAEIGTLVRPSGAIYALDVAQTVGQMRVDVEVIGCDVAFAPARKFLRAPRGTGLLYVRRALADQLVPLTPAFGTEIDERTGRFVLASGLRRFEQYENAIAMRLGLGVAVRYAMQIGLDVIAEAVAERSLEVADLLEGTGGVKLAASRDSRGIVSFVHASLDPVTIRARLAAHGVNVWVNTPIGTPRDAQMRRDVLPSVRVSPHYVTSDDDMAKLHAGLRRL